MEINYEKTPVLLAAGLLEVAKLKKSILLLAKVINNRTEILVKQKQISDKELGQIQWLHLGFVEYFFAVHEGGQKLTDELESIFTFDLDGDEWLFVSIILSAFESYIDTFQPTPCSDKEEIVLLNEIRTAMIWVVFKYYCKHEEM